MKRLLQNLLVLVFCVSCNNPQNIKLEQIYYEKNYSTIPIETIGYLEGYAAGVNYWAALNPTKVDKSLYPVTAKDLVIGMTFRMPLFYGFDHGMKEILDLMNEDTTDEIVLDPNS